MENELVKNNWLAVTETINGLEECQLDLPATVTAAYQNFTTELRRRRLLPSLAYYTGDLLIYAQEYVAAVEDALKSIPAGNTLTSAQNNLLMLGCVIKGCFELYAGC